MALYARGMSQRDIADTIEDIYGFEISHQTISEITDCVLDELSDWQNRPLKKMYTFLFVDCMYVTIRKEYESKNYAVYTILGYDTDGKKDILGLWLNESESKHTWMQIFDELKTRGVEDVLFISMDGVSGLEEDVKQYQECSGTEMHSAFDPKFNQIYSEQGLQKIHTITEKGIRSSQPYSLSKSL